MSDSRLVSVSQIKQFIKVAQGLDFQAQSRKEKYQWINEIILRFRYFSLKKKDKSAVKSYIMKMAGYSDAQTTRLISRKKKVGLLFESRNRRNRFPAVYAPPDIALLAKTDEAHNCLSGPATKRIFKREYAIFGNKEFVRLKDISVSHIYNLRKTHLYRSRVRFFTKTNPAKVAIGQRKKPDPQGKPGYLRVDSVHQGDLDKEKGVYHINLVDETVQWEIIGAAEKISEAYLKPLLEDALTQFPFNISGFHSDNGSEFINRTVAKLLNKLLINQTKSRARQCNDNALVESKNGSVVRKHMGHWHIPQRHAPAINEFYKKHLNLYLNYHRPCGFATVIINDKGKQKKIYDTYETPYERLRSLSGAKEFLKPEIDFKKLDEIAYEKSDNECAALMQKAKDELFKSFKSGDSYLRLIS